MCPRMYWPRAVRSTADASVVSSGSPPAVSVSEEADGVRVRAEATSDIFRELLDAFRSSGQADEDK